MGRQPALRASFLVVGPIEPPIGGVSRYCRSVVDLLRAGGMDADPLDPLRTAADTPGLALRVLRFPLRRALGGPTLSIARAALRLGATLVLDNQQVIWRDPASARGTRLCVRVPYALVIHDGAFPGFVETLGGRARRGLSETLGRLAGVLCMSDPILATVVRTAPRARACRLSPLLTVPGEARPTLPAELEAFFATPGPVITTSGALHPQYGIEELLAAFGELRARGSQARLVLLLGSFASDRRTTAALEAARARHGSEAILALTDVADGAAIIARSRLYVRPSRVDSFGLALYEALLSGVPVVASEHPTRPEGVLTYPAGDAGALARAIEAGLAPEARSAASARTPRLRETVEKNRRETLALLAELAGGARG